MIRVEGLGFSVGEFRLEDASLEVADGEYFVLLGPPGSGKSVFLECLCGLNRAERGRVVIDGQDVTALPPRERGLGYVPQDYALFPHLSAEGNVAFGLRARGRSRADVRKRTTAVADMLGIGHLLKRRIAGLSGGERQRVALARALAVEPRVLLLDEPVSALDESTREAVCSELRRLQSDLRITTIHVSHNLEEAFSVADRGGILRAGSFQQVDSLQNLLRRPRNEFMARFMRCENIFVGHARSPRGSLTPVSVGAAEILVPGRLEGEVRFVIRPENVRLARPGDGTDRAAVSTIPVRLERSVDRGAYVRVQLSGEPDLVAHMPHEAFADLHIAQGDKLDALIRGRAAHVIEA